MDRALSRGSQARHAGETSMNASGLEFGVNLNNREPLLAPAYGLRDLLELSRAVGGAVFDSVWFGDSLFSKPRLEPLMLLAGISQRTQRVRLGTACLVTATRHTPSVAV